jgi:DNA mismatch endonuclease, patch repair protein
MDTVGKKRRGEIMARIRSRDTGPELRLADALRRARASGWRRCRRADGVATPDFVWAKERLALFADGCFFHGCPDCYRTPKSNAEFWDRKIRLNRARDSRQTAELGRLGWMVLRVFECQIGSKRDAELYARIVSRMILPPRRKACPKES